tara:strand:+ start:458 stop:571 length:114 start_codon:yes stop_codon:yes gene_type:complete
MLQIIIEQSLDVIKEMKKKFDLKMVHYIARKSSDEWV